MSRRRNRRRDAAIKTFGLKGSADRECEPLYQSRFQKSDMDWLAGEYQKRSRSEPSLTLEDFAVEYGASADELHVYVSDLSREANHFITLWHGTTVSRARSILREGFRAKKARNEKGRIFFTTKPGMARGIAENRARGDDPPAVLVCSIDLSHYSDYKCRNGDVYVFSHNCIGGEVVKKVERLSGQRSEKPRRKEKGRNTAGDPIHVALTFGSGRTGIAYWLNSYMELDESHRMTEDHEVVERIRQWLDEQVDAGRFGEVPENELLELLQRYGLTKEGCQYASQS